jgi:hypothetical protein
MLSLSTEGSIAMKLIVDYIENAIKFEQLAAQERNPEVSAKLKEQAAAYRKLAEERAEKLGVAPPPEAA